MSGPRREDLSLNTILGPGTSFSGDISAAGFVRIDGSLSGRLEARGRVIIGEQARLVSDVSGTSVVIGGVVKGSVIASERVEVLSTGLVIGDIITRRIQVADGVLLQGQVIACGEADDWEKCLADYLNKRHLAGQQAAENTDGQG